MAENCVVCGSADYDLQDGLYFCSECGTQSQVLELVAYGALGNVDYT